jgi:hypothetical protein
LTFAWAEATPEVPSRDRGDGHGQGHETKRATVLAHPTIVPRHHGVEIVTFDDQAGASLEM